MNPTSLKHNEPKVIAHGHSFTEGPAWHLDSYLLYSDIPERQIYKLQLMADGTWVKCSYLSGIGTNGLSIEAGHKLWVCGDFDRCLYTVNLQESLPEAKMVLNLFEQKQLNSPNDIVVDAKTSWAFFTDPKYGLRNQRAELDFQGIYAFHAQRQKILLLEKELRTPNGIVMNHSRDCLYVADSESDTIFSYPLSWVNETPVFACKEKKVFAKVPIPDGLRLDGAGRLYAASHVPESGVHVFAPSGKQIAKIEIAEACSNCTLQNPSFAAKDHFNKPVTETTLFVTAQDKVYAVKLEEQT